jgi:hypothetical protein
LATNNEARCGQPVRHRVGVSGFTRHYRWQFAALRLVLLIVAGVNAVSDRFRAQRRGWYATRRAGTPG